MKIYTYTVFIGNSFSEKDLTNIFGYEFKKSSLFAQYAKISQDKFLYIFKFGILSFIGFNINEIKHSLDTIKERLNISINESLYQDYDIEIGGEFKISTKIQLPKFEPQRVAILLFCIAQSVALESLELEIEKQFDNSKQILSNYNNLTSKDKSKIIDFITKASKLRYTITSDMHLLDKPDILWDDESGDKIYDEMAIYLELKDRFNIVEYKLRILSEDVKMLTTLTHQRKSEFLEWTIVWLIVVEIIIMVLDIFK